MQFDIDTDKAHKIDAKQPARPTRERPIFIGEDWYDEIVRMVRDFVGDHMLAIIVDEEVAKLYPERLQAIYDTLPRVRIKKIKGSEDSFIELALQWKKSFQVDFLQGFSPTQMREVRKQCQHLNGTFNLFDDLLLLEKERKRVARELKRSGNGSQQREGLEERLYKIETEISKQIAQMNFNKNSGLFV